MTATPTPISDRDALQHTDALASRVARDFIDANSLTRDDHRDCALLDAVECILDDAHDDPEFHFNIDPTLDHDARNALLMTFDHYDAALRLIPSFYAAIDRDYHSCAN